MHGTEQMIEDYYAMKAKLDEAIRIIERVEEKGHYDTCSHALAEQYECDCPHKAALKFLGRMP